MKLACDNEKRIVVLSTFFGSTASPSIDCPRIEQYEKTIPRGILNQTELAMLDQSCKVPTATEQVMNACHGRTRCSVVASEEVFGPPTHCVRRVRYHMKLVYTCIASRMLKNTTLPAEHPTTTTSLTPFTTVSSVPPKKVNHGKLPISYEKPEMEEDNNEVDKEEDDDLITNIIKNHPLMDSSMSSLASGGGSASGGQRNQNPLDPNPKQALNEFYDKDCNCTVLPPSLQMVGFISDWISAVDFLKSTLILKCFRLIFSFLPI